MIHIAIFFFVPTRGLSSAGGNLWSLKKIHDNAKRASVFLKSLANGNRLVILCALADGEKNVSQLEEILGIRQPTLS